LLLELARGHIEGESEIEDVEYRLKAYYADLSARGVTSPVRQIEADIVSANIERLLETDAFVPKKGSDTEVHETTNETTNETTKLILDLMRSNPAITYDEIAASTGKSRATVPG
jgi:predicted HTH transcriptional regulator